jgi:Condensin II non structural maintenance of chromosomes subunit
MLHFFDGVSLMTTAFLQETKSNAPEPVLQILQTMQDPTLMMLLIGFGINDVREHVAQACELWWLQGRTDRETVAYLPFLHLLACSMEPDGKSSDIKRLYNMREYLTMVDLSGEGSETIRDALLKAAIHPRFLQCSEGRRFISILFTLYVPFIDQVHFAMRSQIASCKKSLLKQYGDVYFRAWKLATGQFVLKIEQNVIQDLMRASILAAKSSTATACLNVLRVLHQNKRFKGVDEMLYRLYSPILWRYMKVANPVVRINAVQVFIDVFPLHNPEASRSEADELLQRQFDQLQSLLSDRDAKVRSMGVKGISRVLGVYWELIPTQTIKSFLMALISEMAFDKSSSTVRTAVFEGLEFMLDNHLSHALLKIVLPQLAPLIHDKAETVRNSFLKLLQTVKGIRSIRFFDIVPVDDLLKRLVIDTPRIATKITNILLNSYFPHEKSSHEQEVRALALIRENPAAARVFFSHVHEYVPAAAVCKLVAILYRTVQHASGLSGNASASALSDEDEPSKVTTKRSRSGRVKSRSRRSNNDEDSDEEKDEEQDEDGKENVSQQQRKRRKVSAKRKSKSKKSTKKNAALALDHVMIDNVLLTMAMLWRQIAPQLEKRGNTSLKQFMEETFEDGALQEILMEIATEPARVAVLSMAEQLPESCLPSLSEEAIPFLCALKPDCALKDFCSLLECTFSWGQHHKLMQLIADSLQAGLTKTFDLTSNVSDDVMLHPMLAVRFFDHLLSHRETRRIIFSEAHSVPEADITTATSCSADNPRPDICGHALQQIRDGSMFVETRLRTCEDGDDNLFDTFLLRTFQLNCRVLMHDANNWEQHDSKLEESAIDELRSLIDMVSNVVVPGLGPLPQSDEKSTKTSRTRGGKKSKRYKRSKSDSSDDDTDASVLLEPHVLSMGFARSVILYMSQIATEMLTLGLQSRSHPMPQLTEWLDLLVSESSQSPFKQALLPVFYKVGYQASLHCAFVPEIHGVEQDEQEVEQNVSSVTLRRYMERLLARTPAIALQDKQNNVQACLNAICSVQPAQQPTKEFAQLVLSLLQSRSTGKVDDEPLDSVIGCIEDLTADQQFLLSTIAKVPKAVSMLPHTASTVAHDASMRSDKATAMKWLDTIAGLRVLSDTVNTHANDKAKYLTSIAHALFTFQENWVEADDVRSTCRDLFSAVETQCNALDPVDAADAAMVEAM